MDEALRVSAGRPRAGAVSARRVLSATAVASCLPYLALKTAWLSGSTIGIPPGSVLRDGDAGLVAVNALTVVMDATVIALVFALTRPWGRRLPAWLLTVPMWIASGLIGPIFVAYPGQLLLSLTGAARPAAAHQAPWLDGWVFAVVYTGFAVQGLAIGGLFVLYARERWGRLLRGRLAELPADSPTRPAQRVVAATAALLALVPLAAHTAWACGAATGLSAARAASGNGDFRIVEATCALFAAAAVAGVWALAFRVRPRLRVAVPLGLAWFGAGTTATWGGWMLLAVLPGSGRDIVHADQVSPAMSLIYAVQMTAGVLMAAVGAFWLAERSRQAADRPG